MNLTALFGTAFLVLIGGAFVTLLTARQAKWTGYLNLALVAVAGGIMLYLSGHVFVDGPLEFSYTGWRIAGFPAALVFRIDALSALFVGLISILAVASALYSIGYLPFYRHENPRRYYFPFLLFIAGMLAVVTAADFFYFIVFWEFMTLVSYFLVIYENHLAENLRAGYLYFLMTHISSVGLILAAIVLSGRTGSFAFADLPGVFRELAVTQPGFLHLILAMLFIGFGTKAGMYPLGLWLPEAHPAAPASVSALLSGVMIKMGVYGFLRMFVWMLPVAGIATTWGIVIATFGAISMLVGNLRALGQDDSKRLLAQSSIGQIGYILLGIGVGLAVMPTNAVIGVIAFVGALYHTVNHAFFKSLLFFNTGSVLFCTGTRDLNRMGGLVKIMPLAAACALVGSLAIAGMPPLNGFMSKWLLYQSAIFAGMDFPLFALYGVVAIFISTVSLAAYLKYLGTVYLGALPERYKGEQQGRPVTMESVEIILAAGCVLLGLLPALPVALCYEIVRTAALAGNAPALGTVLGSLAWGGTAVQSAGGTAAANYAPLVVLFALGCGILISYGIYRLHGVPVRPAEVWNCGEVLGAEEVRYRAASFYLPFKACFDPLYRTLAWPQWRLPPLLAKILDFDAWLYFPLGRGFLRTCGGASRTHRGVAQVYLLWQVVGAGIVFLVLFWMMGG